jgi:hypothetical protein
MAYKIIRFGTSQLIPYYNTTQDIGAGRARIEAVDFPHGGAYDQMGKDQSFRGGYQTKVSGTLIGTSEADLDNQYNALRSYQGKKDRLWRRNGDGSLYWVWARLESVGAIREEQHIRYLPVDITFFVFSPLWNGELRGSWRLDSGEVLDSGLDLDMGLVTPLVDKTTILSVVNGGNAVLRSFEFSITAQTTPITSIRIVKADQTDLTWSGVLAVGSQLTIDFGGLSIRNSGLDAYSGLALSLGNHKVDDWMMLDPGTNLITIIRTGGGATSEVAVSYYDGWM